MLNLEETRKCLKNMMIMFDEKRSDVSECLYSILEAEKIEDVILESEHRFIKWKYHGVDFIYDTLTTHVETNATDLKLDEIESGIEDEWKCISVKYED